MATIPITTRGAEKLKAELHKLKTVDRHAVINAISEARAQGDLSENAEYEAAKDRQGFIEGRIQEIEGKLAAAQIIDPATVEAGGKIVFGATVELEEEESGEKVTYQIVGEDEA
ncbi:MAG TPA: transcription elongation factor GreA, partial [Ramlibacter sp.]|nr:transcription elongation factor GreA [Ramlibacter sp.]